MKKETELFPRFIFNDTHDIAYLEVSEGKLHEPAFARLSQAVGTLLEMEEHGVIDGDDFSRLLLELSPGTGAFHDMAKLHAFSKGLPSWLLVSLMRKLVQEKLDDEHEMRQTPLVFACSCTVIDRGNSPCFLMCNKCGDPIPHGKVHFVGGHTLAVSSQEAGDALVNELLLQEYITPEQAENLKLQILLAPLPQYPGGLVQPVGQA